jgi:16S rRNA pseudouridine516 synthase
MGTMRLDRFFSSQEILSRSEVRASLAGIQVNGLPARSPEQKVDPRSDRITLRGEPVGYQPFVYLMLNKPAGYVSSTEDGRSPTVLELVPPELFRRDLFPAGRLDKDTVGFVLLTNDGAFAHRILSPKSHVPKTYHVRLDAPLTEEGIRRLAEGITLADGTLCQGAEARMLEDGRTPLVEIILREGKYHQIKRMFGVLGAGVLWLKRVRIGGLFLDETLSEGRCRAILHKELEEILLNYPATAFDPKAPD